MATSNTSRARRSLAAMHTTCMRSPVAASSPVIKTVPVELARAVCTGEFGNLRSADRVVAYVALSRLSATRLQT